MTPYEFASKWGQATLSESAGSQEHFIDICRLVGHPTPAEADPNGDFFTFEKSLKKDTGRLGFADVWRKNCFAWEYKGQHADLDKAYAQLQLYRESLGNPPLLVVCDFDRYEVHTNFNNTVKRIYRFSNADIPSDSAVDGSTLTPVQVLRALFEDPYSLQRGQSQARLTEEAAELLAKLTTSRTCEVCKSVYEVRHFRYPARDSYPDHKFDYRAHARRSRRKPSTLTTS